ncbi:NAD(P)H-binding protein [Sphingomonas sp. R-74633]|uniref:NAD-dependent epimerase/dehydratase family protein n=1 Tax=Sphingomonas sp. R-74633 TaxID=2751188 RepID=UPI0015D14AF7|nr:NAD-dependent epimerase/dehydratase family protein [Sphingomonas sp. R-74633]NYT41217.1 NAD(P)H-binding protein [Sphingomonas sp. R-74633]
MNRIALVLGASGGVGGETARALLARGWQVRGLVREIRPGLDPDISWHEGDAMVRADVLAAAKGVAAVVHAVNPPGYREWDKRVLPMLENSIEAAWANDARLALPGTIYNYDPAETPVARPESPQEPATRKGSIRKAMEARIEESGVRAVILRAGDYYGPRPGNSWLSQGMITPGKPVVKVTNPGRKGAGHAWAYLPDVGETFARLLDREEELPRFTRFHFAGHWDPDGSAFPTAIAAAGGRKAKQVRLPWSVLPLVALFNPTIRELLEMRPFWNHPVRLDNRALVAFLGEEPHTPLAESLRASLKALGSLE